MKVIVRELIETAILAVLVFVGLQLSVQPYKVEGSSMDPTLEEGEYLLVNKLVYLDFHPSGMLKKVPFLSTDETDRAFLFHPPERGDIIVFRFPQDTSRNFVKRVIGLPGETIEIRQGHVLIDGEEIDEPYIIERGGGSLKPTVVPPNSYFVLGDNRRASDDSRHWGAVPAENVIGKTWISYWPLGRLGSSLSLGD